MAEHGPRGSNGPAEGGAVAPGGPPVGLAGWALDLGWGSEVGTDSDVELDLACPGCGTDLADETLFRTHRVCPRCRRHFALPARERLALLLDPGSFLETNAALLSSDPLVFHDPAPAAAGALAVPPEGVVTGIGAIGGHGAVVIVLDVAFLGGGIGVVAGEKITLGLELAAARRLPVLAVCAGGRGGARAQEGILALAALAKIAAAATRLHRAGVPILSLLTHPTVGGVYAGLANQADLVFAEPGARIGFGGGAGAPPGPSGQDAGVPTLPTAEEALARGLVDDVLDRERQRDLLATMLGLLGVRGPQGSASAPPPMTGSGPPPAGRDTIGLARHPDRPTALDLTRRLLADFVELRGDRAGADDPAIVAGFGRLDGRTVTVVAQERGRGEDRARRRDGRPTAAGFRKATRVMRLAGHLEIPILCLLDGPGVATGPGPEADDLGVVLGQALGLAGMLPVPMVTAIVGEASGPAALAFGGGDRLLMLEHAIFSPVAPPEAPGSAPRGAPGAESASGFRFGSGVVEPAGGGMPTVPGRLTARECHRLGVVDTVVPEPHPGAHADPDAAAHLLRAALVQAFAEVGGVGPRRLVEERARRVRYLGQTTPEGRAATRREVSELQELQRALARSVAELRERWDLRARTPLALRRPHLHLHLPPRHGFHPLQGLTLPRPDLELAARLAARRGGGSTGAGGLDAADDTAEPGDAPDREGTA